MPPDIREFLVLFWLYNENKITLIISIDGKFIATTRGDIQISEIIIRNYY